MSYAKRSVGSLFSGIGGFDLGLERAGFNIDWQVENNDYCRQVLQKHWPKVPCHYDIKDIDWRYIPRVDLVCGGFPCQPFSLAGKRRSKADNRYLWPEVVRCLDTLRPTWFIGENVPGIINMALDQVCIDLESLGYQVWPVCLPACAVDAPHIRQRVWIVAHHYGQWKSQPQRVEQNQRRRASDSSEDVADTPRELSHGAGPYSARRKELADRREWPAEPDVGQLAHGVPNRVDRLKGLGNAIVPQIAEVLGKMILEVEHDLHDL